MPRPKSLLSTHGDHCHNKGRKEVCESRVKNWQVPQVPERSKNKNVRKHMSTSGITTTGITTTGITTSGITTAGITTTGITTAGITTAGITTTGITTRATKTVN